MDGHPSDRSLICVAIGYELLELQGPSTDETEGRTHGARAIHMALPQRSQRVSVIEGDATLLKVKAHTEPRRQRVGEACGRRGAVAIGDGVSAAVPMATMVVAAVMGQVDFTHPHSEEAERRSRVQGIFRSTVVATVWVVAAEAAQHEKSGGN